MPNISDDIKKESLKGIVPLGNNVYLYVLPRATKIGIIEVPTQTAQRTEEAIVIAIGKGVEELGVGDKVLISFHSGTHIQLPETYSREPQHRIIAEFNILVKVNQDAT